ncbi:unnamed protein product [Rotaria sordida]|uniref:Uncharacterized protein n=1 Tax=Rotaria sordida TaxID=392033 RepID=A0A815IWS2_9BILA|nr:unnamed protein product [Rotaria sordida]
MLFHPNKLELAITGNDGFVKVWTFVQENPITKRVSHWRCLSGHTHRSYSSFALCYYKLSTSENINLCCSFEHLVTVWIDTINDLNEESRYEYSRCFAHIDRKNPVEHVIYNCDKILVCHKTLANLWNCLNGQFIKSFSWHVHAFAKNPRSSFIALFDKSFLHFYSFSDGKCHSRKEFRYEYSRCFAHSDRKNPVEHVIYNCDKILVCHKTLVNLWNCLNGQFIKSFSWHVHAFAKDPRSSFIALFDKSFFHFYSFSDGKCHSRKGSLFRRVTAAAYIPNDKPSSFVPLQHSRLIFYIPQEVRFFFVYFLFSIHKSVADPGNFEGRGT